MGFSTGTENVRFSPSFEGSFWPQRVWVPRHKRMTYKFIFDVVIVLEY